MKKYTILLLVLLASGFVFSQTPAEKQLKEFGEQQQFVKMDSLNNKVKTKEFFYYKAFFANVCNNPSLSNLYLDNLKPGPITKSFKYYKLKNDNYLKLFDYANAYQTSKILTTQFPKSFTAEELNDELNTQRIWEVLKLLNPQTIDEFTSVAVTAKKDIAGLITTTVSANDTASDFVFDTGAGISCITESMANKLGLTILPDNNINVMSFTGIENKVLIGVAPILSIGNITIHNVVFLVYPDTAFTFANGAYVINGIIGFPIIKELGTVTVEENSLTFSKKNTTERKERNLFTDQLRSVLMLTYKDKTLPFNFDSGAKESTFNKSFYDLFQYYLDKNGTLVSEKTAGAGGQEVVSELLEVKDQNIRLGKLAIGLKKLQVDKSNYGVYGKANYGNIGQDVISQFKKVTISFDGNYLKLEN